MKLTTSASPTSSLLLLSVAFRISKSQSLASCSPSLTPTASIKPSVASGYQAALVATGLTKPRSLQFDTDGNLLVIESGKGLTSIQLQDNGGDCLSVKSKKTVISNGDLNHGLALSQDGKTLYASDSLAAYAWNYTSNQSSVSGTNQTVVGGMVSNGHSTRTLLLSQKEPSLLLISHGSGPNIDIVAEDVTAGVSQIRAFNISNATGAYDYSNDGLRLGWGLRNSVGVAEHPVTGGIFSVENSADQIVRDGKDIHQDNPGEELNFHGYLNGTEYDKQGTNYGYPLCFAAWGLGDMPNSSQLKVGSNFALDSKNATINDTYCGEQTAPRLTFQAHQAPLDIKFNNSGNEGWVTFHGSWDRSQPVGYKLAMIPFANGQPVATSDNKTSYVEVLSNQDNSKCPDNCFRPVGMAFDSQGRLFMSSDGSGEIYVVSRLASGSGNSSTTGQRNGGTSRQSLTSTTLALAAILVALAVL